MPLDPQAAAHLEKTKHLPKVETLPAAEGRANAERAAPLVAGPPPHVDRVEERELEGPAGPVRVRVYGHGEGGERPVLVWFHGGGWVIGSLDTHDVACRELARRSGCVVVAVEYRLAPEHRYPAAVEDCWAAVEWVASNAAEVGGRRGLLAVGGDSAGGNLAAVVALRARDRGVPLAAQLLVYPVTDHDFETSSYRTNAGGFGLTEPAMRWYWDHYVPDPARRAEPEASPLRAPDVSGVAPALVVVCEYDPLHDEGVAYARRLEDAGVPVRVSRYEGMIHGFLRMTAVLDRSHDLLDELAEELQRTFATTSS